VFAEELREDPHDLVANLLIGLLPQVSRTALLTLALISAGYRCSQRRQPIGRHRPGDLAADPPQQDADYQVGALRLADWPGVF